MELILAILGAGPIGHFAPTRRHGLVMYLGVALNQSAPWQQRVDTPVARAFLSRYVQLP